MEPAQELVLTEAQAKGEEIVQLRYVVSSRLGDESVDSYLSFAIALHESILPERLYCGQPRRR